MPTKSEKYLQKDVKQNRLFDEIEEDILKILRKYPFKKVLKVKHIETGKLIVELQDDFPSQVINDLNEYMGFECTIHKSDYHIDLIYKLPKEFWL